MKLVKAFINKMKNTWDKNKRINVDANKEKIYAWHINAWKREYVANIFSDKQLLFFPFNLTVKGFNKHWRQNVLDNDNNSILIWGMNCPDFLEKFILENKIKVRYVEDGFIRSIDLGANHTLPLSLNFDSKTLYFDAFKESDLEYLLKTYDFKKDKTLMQRAENLKKYILESGISKYNHAKEINLDELYGKKTKKRVLVVGQVEEDASIVYGCKKPFTNNDLVCLAYEENPDAQIIYKPHPDVFFKKRKEVSNPEDVKNKAQIITESLPIAQALETVDHVYTITSQVGFEALLRGIKVTTIGSPFYSNWGVTDDRQENIRRTKILSVDEILAAAYILYPSYYHPVTGAKITPEEAIGILLEQKEMVA